MAGLKIDFPLQNFKYKEINGKRSIWDSVRQKWVYLSPEEWVRQNFIHFLHICLQYPTSLMAIEKEIIVGELKKRCDIVLYKNERPWMIVECKEMDVALSDAVLMQILRYNMTLEVPYLIITNGKQTYGWMRSGNELVLLQELPHW